jgi:hypothetical protein
MRDRLGATILICASLLLPSPAALASDVPAPPSRLKNADQAPKNHDRPGTTTVRDRAPANQPAPADPFDKTHYAGSFQIDITPSDMSHGTLYLPRRGHDRVEKVEVLDLVDSGITYGSFTPRDGMTTVPFGPFEVGRHYHLIVKTHFKDGDTRSLSASLVNKPRPGTCRNLRVEDVDGAVFLKWENTLVPKEIRRVRVSVRDWRVDVKAEKDSVEVTRGLRQGGNELRLSVIDRFGDQIFDETLDVAWYGGVGRAR